MEIAFRVGNDRNEVVVAGLCPLGCLLCGEVVFHAPVSVHITLGYRSQPLLEVSWRKEQRTISAKGVISIHRLPTTTARD
jgi:hypothetical protein